MARRTAVRDRATPPSQSLESGRHRAAAATIRGSDRPPPGRVLALSDELRSDLLVSGDGRLDRPLISDRYSADCQNEDPEDRGEDRRIGRGAEDRCDGEHPDQRHDKGLPPLPIAKRPYQQRQDDNGVQRPADDSGLKGDDQNEDIRREILSRAVASCRSAALGPEASPNGRSQGCPVLGGPDRGGGWMILRRLVTRGDTFADDLDQPGAGARLTVRRLFWTGET